MQTGSKNLSTFSMFIRILFNQRTDRSIRAGPTEYTSEIQKSINCIRCGLKLVVFIIYRKTTVRHLTQQFFLSNTIMLIISFYL